MWVMPSTNFAPYLSSIPLPRLGPLWTSRDTLSLHSLPISCSEKHMRREDLLVLGPKYWPWSERWSNVLSLPAWSGPKWTCTDPLPSAQASGEASKWTGSIRPWLGRWQQCVWRPLQMCCCSQPDQSQNEVVHRGETSWGVLMNPPHTCYAGTPSKSRNTPYTGKSWLWDWCRL